MTKQDLFKPHADAERRLRNRNLRRHYGACAIEASALVAVVYGAYYGINQTQDMIDDYMERKAIEALTEEVNPLMYDFTEPIVQRHSSLDLTAGSEVVLDGKTIPAALLDSTEWPPMGSSDLTASRVDIVVSKDGSPADLSDYGDVMTNDDEEFKRFTDEARTETYVIPLTRGDGIYDINIRSELADNNAYDLSIPFDSSVDDSDISYSPTENIEVVVKDGEVDESATARRSREYASSNDILFYEPPS